MNDEQVIDFTKLKYVLYARKSTDDPKRQARSIPDQIAECEDLASRFPLQIIDVLIEEKTAKKPNQRPVFMQMIKDIKAGKQAEKELNGRIHTIAVASGSDTLRKLRDEEPDMLVPDLKGYMKIVEKMIGP